MLGLPQTLRWKPARGVIASSLLLFTILVVFLAPYGRVDSSNKGRYQSPPSSNIGPLDGAVDWSRFAYVQYVTNTAYLCNSLMIFESLHRLGTKADRLMMYPAHYYPDQDTEEGRLLSKARDIYGVKLTPIEVQRRSSNDATWAESYTKLLAFNQTEYDRLICLDSDAVVLQLMDELFFLPSCPVAIPRAFWLNPEDHILSSQIFVIQPSTMEFQRVSRAITSAGPNDYDMEIVNRLYGNSAMIIPHRRYDLLTSAFRENHSEAYLGNDVEQWDPDKVLKEAKFLHFSDWPVPKPWVPNYQKMEELKPDCEAENVCRAREIWFGFYSDFARRRKVTDCFQDLSFIGKADNFQGNLWDICASPTKPELAHDGEKRDARARERSSAWLYRGDLTTGNMGGGRDY